MSRLKDIYNSEIVDAMMKKFKYKNIMQVPKIEKIVINMGVGEAGKRKGVRIRNQRHAGHYRSESCYNKSQKSVANFKVREGMRSDAKQL